MLTRIYPWTLLFGLIVAAVLSTGGEGRAATVSTFSGGDAGEGLDLDGIFPYAVNIGGAGTSGTAPNLAVRDAVFRDPYNGGFLIPGVSVIYTAINNWSTKPVYGATANDNNLEEVLWDIGHGGNLPMVQFDNLKANHDYKVQVILNENIVDYDRSGSYLIYGGSYVGDPVGAGRTILDSALNVNITDIVGAGNTTTTGVVVTLRVNTGSFTTLSITSRNGTGGPDVNAIINAVTVELVPEPSTALLTGLGLVGLVMRRRRTRKRLGISHHDKN